MTARESWPARTSRGAFRRGAKVRAGGAGLLRDAALTPKRRVLVVGSVRVPRGIGEAVGGVLRTAADVGWSSTEASFFDDGTGGGGVVVRVICVVLLFLL